MKIIFVAGGTGGHIYPALTLANELKNRGHEILFIGSSSRMEKDAVPSAGFKYIGLDVSIPKGNIFNKAKPFFSLVGAYNKCKDLVKGYDAAIGFGNYISLPVMLAAKKLGLKTIIHEQNSFAGKANLYLDTKMDYVICSYDVKRLEIRKGKIFKTSSDIPSPESEKIINTYVEIPCGQCLEDGRTRTLEEVGKEFDVTRERIRQIEAKALRKLKNPTKCKRLKEFLEDKN